MILTSTDGHFKMLALRTMSGDELKDGVNNATSFLEEFDYVLHVCGFVRQNQHCIEHKACINCN